MSGRTRFQDWHKPTTGGIAVLNYLVAASRVVRFENDKEQNAPTPPGLSEMIDQAIRDFGYFDPLSLERWLDGPE